MGRTQAWHTTWWSGAARWRTAGAASPRPADVAVDGGTITAVGTVGGAGHEEIDADRPAGHARASSTSTRTTTGRPRGTRDSPRRAGTA